MHAITLKIMDWCIDHHERPGQSRVKFDVLYIRAWPIQDAILKSNTVKSLGMSLIQNTGFVYTRKACKIITMPTLPDANQISNKGH